MQGTIIKQWHPSPWTNNMVINIRRLGRHRYVVDKTIGRSLISVTASDMFNVTAVIYRRRLIGICRSLKEAEELLAYRMLFKEGPKAEQLAKERGIL